VQASLRRSPFSVFDSLLQATFDAVESCAHDGRLFPI
jgi:hypothetical protein